MREGKGLSAFLDRGNLLRALVRSVFGRTPNTKEVTLRQRARYFGYTLRAQWHCGPSLATNSAVVRIGGDGVGLIESCSDCHPHPWSLRGDVMSLGANVFGELVPRRSRS